MFKDTSGNNKNLSGANVIPFGSGHINFVDGLLSSYEYNLANASIPVPNVGTFNFVNGMYAGLT